MSRAAILVLAVLCWPAPARAHKPSDSYLTVRPRGGALEGRWDIAVRDLDHALVLDADGDGAVTWGEVRRREAEITATALGAVTFATSGPCAVTAGALETVEHSDGAYLSLPLRLRCAPSRSLSVDYRLFVGIDPQHRAIVRIDDPRADSAVLSPGAGPRTLAMAGPGAAPPLLSFVSEGVRHIWGGLDHVLFLVALLLPAVLRRQGGQWRPAPAIRSVLLDVGRIVTAFTAAHSLTLTAATLGLVSVSSRVIEPAIAASVALAAANNVRPVFAADRWVVAFALGLLHGFGFSSVLADAGLPPGALGRALLGFNAGVELGQLALVALFVPAAFLVRGRAAYRGVAVPAGSAVITAVALFWIVQRITNG